MKTTMKIAIISMMGMGLGVKAQVSQVLSGGTPLFFTSTGVGVYDRTVLYHDNSNGFLLELAKHTNSYNSTPIDFSINARGGNHPFFTIKGSNGNVGIGTTNPATLLNVNVGNGGSNGTAGLRIGGLGNYASLELGVDGNYDGMIRSYGNNLKYYAGHWKIKGNTATENHSHNWYTSKAGSSNWSTVKMTLNHDGNLGIGTLNPGAWKLAVNGNIRAKEIKVETGWSDFVFYDNYKLPTLKEVENHIKEKGHLKDIPSAEEVDENGIFLGEMNSKLLQKIEELTLYTIRQQKEIEILKEEKKELKSINTKLLELQKRLEKLENK